MQIKSNLKKSNHQDLALESRTQRRGLGSHPIILFFILYSLFFIPFSVSAFQKPPNNLGLVGYWSLDDGTGTIATDMSGKGSNGTLTNGPTWANGKRGKSVRFDGVNDFITMGDAPPLKIAGTAITISAWVRHDSDSFKNWEFIAGKGDSTYRLSLCGGPAFCEGGATLNGFTFAINDGSNLGVGSTIVPVTGRWYHVAATYNGSIARLYIDGVESATDSYATSIVNDTQPFYIGENSQSTGRQWTGAIDEVRVYNRVLTATEISALYGAGSAKFTTPSSTGLVGYWPMDDATSTIVSDLSGSGNNGNLVNAPTWVNGKFGKGLNFVSASLKYVQAPASSVFPKNNMTISAWYKPESVTANANNGHIIGFRNADTSDNFYFNHLLNSANVEARYRNSAGTAVTITLSNILTAGKWTHLALVYNGSTLTPYINGIAQTPSGATGAFSSTDRPFFIGGETTLANHYTDGVIDEARVYNRELSAAEIAGLYRSGQVYTNASQNNKVTRGLVALWSFNGPDVNWATGQVFDRSGNNNHGTMSGLSQSLSLDLGVNGQALKFNGSNYISLASPSNLPDIGGALTMSLWLKYPSVASRMIAFSLVKDDTSGGNNSVDIELTSADPSKIGAVQWGATTLLSATAPAVNQWHNITYIQTGSGTQLYIDGVLSATGSNPIQSGVVGVVRIGSFNNAYPCPCWNGSIDEVRVYNRAVSASEAKQLYNMGRSQ